MEYIILFNRHAIGIAHIPLSDLVICFSKTAQRMIRDALPHYIIHAFEYGWLIRVQPFKDTTYFCFVSPAGSQSQNFIGTNGRDNRDAIRREADIMLYHTPSDCLTRVFVENEV